jgi:hypothetical protein
MAKPVEPAAEGRAAQPETALTGAGLAAGDADAGAGDVAAEAPPQPCRATRPNGTPSSSFRRADRAGCGLGAVSVNSIFRGGRMVG